MISTGGDCARDEDVTVIPGSYPDEVGLLESAKVGTAAVLTVAIEVTLRKREAREVMRMAI